jgi:PAS domain S-box-containing protein
MEINYTPPITFLFGALMMAGILGFFYYRDRHDFLKWWACAWVLTSVQNFLHLLAAKFGLPVDCAVVVDYCIAIGIPFCLLVGTLYFVGNEKRRIWYYFLFVAVGLTIALCFFDVPPWGGILPGIIYMIVLYLASAFTVLKIPGKTTSGAAITGYSFIVLAIFKTSQLVILFFPWDEDWQHVFHFGAGVSLALGLLILYHDRLRSESLQKEQQYRLLAENARDVIYRWRILPSPAVEYVSPSVENLLGMAPEQIVAKAAGWENLLHPDDLLVPQKSLTSIQDWYSQPILVRLKHKDGHFVTTEHQLVPILDGNQNVVAVEGICRDISERVQAEARQERLAQQLLQAQKMEALGLLAGGVAHDINNVLASIMGVASLLERRQGADDKTKHSLEMILSSCERGRDLTYNLLGFARKAVMRRKPVVLEDTVQSVANLLGRTLPKSVTILTDMSDTKATVNGDPGQIEQMLMNLVLNAVDAIKGDGEIVIRIDTVEMTNADLVGQPSLDTGNYARLAVVDAGQGMSPEVAGRVFEPFFTTKPQGQGTGLGLSMVYGVASSHGGFVDLQSVPDEGTTVTVYFPTLEESISVEHQGEHPSQLIAHGQPVLLVDDEKNIREIGKDMLVAIGYEVQVASSGKSACELFSKNQPELSLVVLDIAMPEMDGMETYKRLKQINPNVRVLFITGYARESFPSDMLSDGRVDMLQKPFNMKELIDSLKSLKDGD